MTRLSCYAESRFEMKVYVHFEIIFGNREIRISADKNENVFESFMRKLGIKIRFEDYVGFEKVRKHL